MKCKNCGAEIDILQKFCSNCGSPNELTKEHIKDMDRYENRFKETKEKVERNTKWYVKYTKPIQMLTTAIAIVIIMMIFSFVVYCIIDTNKTKADSEKLYALLDNGEYITVYEKYYNDNEYLGAGSGFYSENGWYDFYKIAGAYADIKTNIELLYEPSAKNNSNSYDNAMHNLCNAISKAYESEYYNNGSYKNASLEPAKYIDDIYSELNVLLKAYCNLTDDDINSLAGMSSNSINVLLVKNMDNN